MSGGSSRRRAGSSWHSSFSRLFHRSSSKEQEEEGKAAPQPHRADSFEVKENESTSVACRRKESNPPSDLTKISVCENKNLSTEELSRSPTWEELKKARSLPSLVHEGKTASNGKQAKEGFLQFLGSLFGISSKSSWKETEQSIPGDGSSRTGKDVGSPVIHQNGTHPEPEIFRFSVSRSTSGLSGEAEQRNTCSDTQDLQEAQGKTAEASKKTDCELGTSEVTYATYRGSARIKQLLKKRAELEQEKEAPTSSISSTAKNNRTVDLPELESNARKEELSLKENSKPETKDDSKDAQMNTFLAEMDLKNNAEDVLGSNDNKEPNAAVPLLAEMKIMKNCIKDVVSEKHASGSKILEVNRNLVLDPVLLPQEASFSCQNIDPVRISSENNRLVEKGEEVLGETEAQLQSNNATIVDFQKGMHFCALSNTETNEKIQHECSSYLKVYSFDDGEQQLLKGKCSCYNVEDQFNLKSGDQILYLDNNLCSGQKASSITDGNKSSHKYLTKDKEEISQISSVVHLPHKQRHHEELHDVECKKTNTVTEGINLSVSAQFPETIQEAEMHSKNSPKNQRTTESVELTQINPNFNMVSETECNCVTVDNFCMPLVKGDHVEVTTALPRITQMSNTSTALSSALCENGQYSVPCASLETKGDTTSKAVAPEDNSTFILETKDAGSAVTTKPSPPQTTELMVNNLSIATGKNGPLVHEMTDHFKPEKAPAASEVKEIVTVDLSPVSPSTKVFLPKSSSPVKPENSSPTILSSTTTSILANNVFIFEDSIHLDDMSKSLSKSDDQNLLKTTVEMDEQAVPTLFTKSCSHFSDKILKDVETGKQVQIRSQDLAVLFKKADEIVDAVLHLAIEEIQSKRAAGVCQSNDINSSLLGPSLQKDQKMREMLSESKEIQLKNLSLQKNLSLKHFNETCIRRLSGIKTKDTVGTGIQDEIMPFDITNKIDLHSSLALEAKQIIDDVNAAKHQLTYSQQEENLSKGPSQNTILMSKIEAPKRLIMDTKLTDKPPEITKELLSLSQVYPTEVHNIAVEYEIASSFASLHINDDKEVTREEMVPNKAFAWQNYGDKCNDSTARLESSHKTVDNDKNSQGVNGSTHMTAVGSKMSDKSYYPLYAGNGETVMTREQLSSCLSLPENALLPAFNSNVCANACLSNKSEGDLLGNHIRDDLSKYSYNHNTFPFFATEEPHGSSYETGSERSYSKSKKVCTESQNKDDISESSVKNSSPMIESIFFSEEEQIIGATIDDLHKENYLDDIKEKSSQCFAFSLPKEWEGDSSFAILYEDSLQEDSCSSAEPEQSLPPLPGLSLNNIEHLLMYEASKDKHNSGQTYEDGNQVNEMLDSTRSESFMTVEAKRYKVYPFSLSPIYEDDSSQEDLLSTDISPGGHSSEKSRDSNNPSSSVLSLLQSVSERLKSSNQYFEERLGEENELEDKKEVCLPSCLAGSPNAAIIGNVHERNLLSRHSHLSKDTFTEEEASPHTSVHSAQLPQKCDLDTKPFSRSAFYECLQNPDSYAYGKGARFESFLVTKDHQTQYNDLQKSGAFQVCPIDREKLRCNPRPGKMVICDLKDSKNKHEIYHDELDTTAWMFSDEAVIRVVRGCWILYEKPEFQGQNFVLEEGEKQLGGIWDTQAEKYQGNFTVGSIRQVVKSCSVPEIELSPQTGADNSPVCIQNAIANLEELEVKNPTLLVKAGVWLAYTEACYKGEVIVLEENHNLCELSAADIKSLHPLKMGGLKVQMPMNVKMMIYEKPHFEGWCKEFSENIDYVPALFKDIDDFQGIGSIYVVGGIWVAYEKERYKGKQYLLEEGEYDDWQSWDGVSNVLLSFRFLQADFMESGVSLFEMDEDNGKLLEIINQEIPDLDQTGFGSMTRSLNVKSGVWVAYQQKCFCGEQYILEKGKYKCFLDWGGQNETIMSIRPVKLEPLEHHAPPHWLKAFSNTHFQGLCLDFTTEISDFASFKPCSFKVLRGCWLLCYQGETAVNQCVLEEGLYTDLASCGCPVDAIVSLRPIKYVFAESFISLFAVEDCEGRELHLREAVSSVLNKDLHFLTQSMWVRSGQWIAYEGSNFLGKQFLLEPGKILNWTHFSGWKAIGSLRPVKQPAVYFRIKNRSQDKFLTIAGNLTDARATSVCLSPLNGKDTQIWRYKCGLIKSKVNDACLDVIGGRDVPGAKVALWVEHGKARQKWTFNQDGTIISYLSDQLVLDIRGGYYYDRNHIVVNQLNVSESTQRWDFEIV